jgi:hypothetical protein
VYHPRDPWSEEIDASVYSVSFRGCGYAALGYSYYYPLISSHGAKIFKTTDVADARGFVTINAAYPRASATSAVLNLVAATPRWEICEICGYYLLFGCGYAALGYSCYSRLISPRGAKTFRAIEIWPQRAPQPSSPASSSGRKPRLAASQRSSPNATLAGLSGK